MSKIFHTANALALIEGQDYTGISLHVENAIIARSHKNIKRMPSQMQGLCGEL